MNFDNLDWYMVSPSDVLRVWRDDEDNPRVLGQSLNRVFNWEPYKGNYRNKLPQETWDYYFKPR